MDKIRDHSVGGYEYLIRVAIKTVTGSVGGGMNEYLNRDRLRGGGVLYLYLAGTGSEEGVCRPGRDAGARQVKTTNDVASFGWKKREPTPDRSGAWAATRGLRCWTPGRLTVRRTAITSPNVSFGTGFQGLLSITQCKRVTG